MIHQIHPDPASLTVTQYLDQTGLLIGSLTQGRTAQRAEEREGGGGWNKPVNQDRFNSKA